MEYSIYTGQGRLYAGRFVDGNPLDSIKIVIVGRKDGHTQFFHHGQSERVIGQ